MHNKHWKKTHLLLALVATGITAVTAQTNHQLTAWPTITNQMKPWTRWWWMGNAVDKHNLERRLSQMDSVGIGGVEITPIYGAKGYEASYINFLSPKWMEMLKYTVDKSRQLGMGVDMNTGTGWPFGGPQITPELAAGRLLIRTYTVDGGQQATMKIAPPENDSTVKQYGATLNALTAYGSNGEVVNLIDKVSQNGQLNWTAPAGQWTLYAGFAGKTGQMVKRAALGGEGLVMDHFNPAALNTYLYRFDTAFGSQPVGIRSFFNDSYEVYDADFTPGFFEEFRKRRGYDARLYLKQLVSKEESDTTIRVRADYRQTVSELVYDNFTKPWNQWAKRHNGLSRNQAHDSPGNLLDLYAAVDIPEPEMFGIIPVDVPGMKYYTDYGKTVHAAPDPVMVKFAASAAGIFGKPLVSCETFTWMGEHFKVPLSHCKPEVQQAFLAGVNHIFFHGSTYSPEEAAWPGWLFYASVNFAPSNSFWPHLGGLDGYIERTQSILQNSTTDNELMVYWPVDDVRHHAGKGTVLQMLEINKIADWLQPSAFYKEVTSLMQEGYQLDYVSDNYLKAASVVNGSDIKVSATGLLHKVLVVPETAYMPEATFETMLKLAGDGATVVLQKLPADVPGFYNVEQRREHLKQMVNGLSFTEAGGDVQKAVVGKGQVLLAADLQKGLQFVKIYGETITGSGLKFIRKIRGNGKSYYVVNHTAHNIDEWLTIHTPATTVIILDPQDGRHGLAAAQKVEQATKVHVQVAAGDAIFIETSTTNAPVNKWVYTIIDDKGIAIKGPWKLHFTTGGPNLPKDQVLNKLTSWTELDDEEAKRFAGTGVYTTTFRLPATNAYDYELDLGDVRESAHIIVNGKDAGIVWYVPATIKIGRFLKPGENTIRIEVANLMANRIIDMDKQKLEWRKFRDINFVNINYQEFDASGWALQPSGLLGPVTLLPIRKE